jgi:cell division septal protein FtsQ
MSVKTSVEKRFRRARVKPGKRKRNRGRVLLLAVRHAVAIAVVGYALYRAVNLVVSAAPLQVARIVVRGNVRLSSGEVEALVHGLYGTSILRANLNACRRRLLESPWVADVALRRVLPSTIEIAVSERRPMGISRIGDQLYLIDRGGTVIDEFGPQYREFDLPIIDGLVRPPRDGQPAVDAVRAEFAARVLDSVAGHREIAKRVSQIDVSDLHDAVVLLDDDTAQLHLGEDKFVERLRSYLEVASALRERVPDIDYVDLRFEERVYVRPRGGGAAITAHPPSAAAKSF